MDYSILKELCAIHGPSGDERPVRDYIMAYVKKNSSQWTCKPKMHFGEGLQDCLILQFGDPKTAAFCHMDSHGFTVRYENQLVPIGGPDADSGTKLVGSDIFGEILCELVIDDDHRSRYKFGRAIQTGTSLVYQPNWRETDKTVQCCYMDNRLGLFAMLKLAETLENGLLVFSCWEEHGGGSVPFLISFIHEKWKIKQALIADITWVTEGVQPGKGVVISMRDRNIPRQSFIRKILAVATESGLDFQIEVEGSGSSDGREIQLSSSAMDWCFIGAPEDHVHSPDELVDKRDVESMIEMYSLLMKVL